LAQVGPTIGLTPDMSHTQYEAMRLLCGIKYVHNVFREEEEVEDELHYLTRDVDRDAYNAFSVPMKAERLHDNVGEQGQIGAECVKSMHVTCNDRSDSKTVHDVLEEKVEDELHYLTRVALASFDEAKMVDSSNVGGEGQIGEAGDESVCSTCSGESSTTSSNYCHSNSDSISSPKKTYFSL